MDATDEMVRDIRRDLGLDKTQKQENSQTGQEGRTNLQDK
jgi:hypothetical protein